MTAEIAIQIIIIGYMVGWSMATLMLESGTGPQQLECLLRRLERLGLIRVDRRL
jgi:hypothetical protein